ncbi:hypothetical protein NW768_007637 [Fusarium equiseti]|uniref:Fucose-specific lectin n=1 Tax=Fusarium equiseti TaxID=61235 RepID=A0ABQ8R8A5_FUSEQ|nr:hypothetical protein NW768_007637 [Fusarium equiseti]
MSGEIKTIARALRSASLNTLPNGDLTFLQFAGRRLIEKVYDDEELKDQRVVAVGVRKDSTAAYALAKDRTFAVYISDHNTITASEYDEDSEEWDEAELEGLGNVSVHDEGHIAVVGVPTMNLVLYQAPDGNIKTVNHEKGSGIWTEGFDVPGSALFASSGDDNELHAHSRSFITGDWTEEVIPESSFDETIDSIIVAKDKGRGNFKAYVLSNDTVYNIAKDGSRDTLGQFNQDGDFVPS